MIELDEFIRATLESVVKGVSAAQKAEMGNLINPAHVPSGQAANERMYYYGGNRYTIIDFEIAVSAETKADGKAAVKVFGVDVGGGGGMSSGKTNKIAFSLPIQIPGPTKS